MWFAQLLTSGVLPWPSQISVEWLRAACHSLSVSVASTSLGSGGGSFRSSPSGGSESAKSGAANVAAKSRHTWPRPSWWLASATPSSSSGGAWWLSCARKRTRARSKSRSQPRATQRSHSRNSSAVSLSAGCGWAAFTCGAVSAAASSDRAAGGASSANRSRFIGSFMEALSLLLISVCS